MAAPERRTGRSNVVQGQPGTPFPAWFGECNEPEVSRMLCRLWCAWHNNGAGAFLPRHEAFAARQRGNTDKRSCVGCATRRGRDAPYADAPSLKQCHDMMPLLSSRRQTAWRSKHFDGAAAALLLQSWHAECAGSESDDDDEVRDAARLGS